MTDHVRQRVVWVGVRRSMKTLEGFFNQLGEQRASNLEVVSIDMAGAYIEAVRKPRLTARHPEPGAPAGGISLDERLESRPCCPRDPALQRGPGRPWLATLEDRAERLEGADLSVRVALPAVTGTEQALVHTRVGELKFERVAVRGPLVVQIASHIPLTTHRSCLRKSGTLLGPSG